MKMIDGHNSSFIPGVVSIGPVASVEVQLTNSKVIAKLTEKTIALFVQKRH